MSAYDVEIGKLISGRRDLEGGGTYFLCTPDKKIVEIDSYSSTDGIVLTSQDVGDTFEGPTEAGYEADPGDGGTGFGPALVT